MLSSLRREFPGVPLVAVTATATSAVIKEISGILALKQPKILIGSFNRPNITYSVRHKELIGDGSDAAALQVQMHTAACIKHTQLTLTHAFAHQTLASTSLPPSLMHTDSQQSVCTGRLKV